MAPLVVDAGRLHWLIGRAGEDSPDAGMPSQQLTYDASVFPKHGDQQALRERRDANWALFDAYESSLRINIDDDDEDDDAYDGIALFTATVFDDATSPHIRDVADHVFAHDSTLRISHIHFVLQELLVLYASGRTTGLVINLGHDLTILGVYDGHMLGESARRVPMSVSEDVFLESFERWEETMQLTSLVTSAVMSAPIDTRRQLLQNVIIAGGRWGGWPQLQSHLTSRLEDWLTSRRQKVAVKVIKPPEAGASVWIGGSVLGGLMRTRVPYLTPTSWRARQELPVATHEEAGNTCPAHLLRQDSGPLLLQEAWGQWDSRLLPADELAWGGDAHKLALALVCAAPSVCAKLPLELRDVIAAALLRQVDWLTIASPRARAFLPPPEDMWAASADEAKSISLITAARDITNTALGDEGHLARSRAFAPCMAELQERMMASSRAR